MLLSEKFKNQKMKYHIIKLGGSVITGKKHMPSFNQENTTRIAKELFLCYPNCILVHGTGNFGKPPAIQYGYYQSGIIDKKNYLVALKIKNSLRQLNQLVIDTLITCGIPAIPLDIYSFYDEAEDEIDFKKSKNKLLGLLKNKILPVLYGDLISMADGRFRVISSDHITWMLSRIFHPETVIFLSDVDGVYLARSERLPQNCYYLTDRLDQKNIHMFYQMDSDEKDVSGGMKRKVETALEISKYCDTCFIGSGYEDDIIGRVLEGENVKGTYVG